MVTTVDFCFHFRFTFHKDLLGDPMDGDLTAPGRGSEEAEEMESLGFDRITEVLLLPIVESFIFAHVRPPQNFWLRRKLWILDGV